ncbi:MAG: zinc metallopeptidase [Xanthomonadales bacterium]|nr:zinc metallopeptidase [Xanthomonadales bacterium]NNL96026.1 zinc metallopeptidase [Xanthomonadales bacterium]
MPWLILILIILAVVFGPGLWVQRVMKRYSRPKDRYSGSGGELARELLDRQGLTTVKVELTEKGDHYDPSEKVVRLSKDNLDGRSLTAITVAAHEVGHAVQDARGYQPLKARTRLVGVAQQAQRFGAMVLIGAPLIGLLTRAPSIAGLMLLGGFLSLGSATLVHLVTLPTELDASFRRALPMLRDADILYDVDVPHAQRILRAAAMTYVSASLMSLLNIARWWALLRA